MNKSIYVYIVFKYFYICIYFISFVYFYIELNSTNQFESAIQINSLAKKLSEERRRCKERISDSVCARLHTMMCGDI